MISSKVNLSTCPSTTKGLHPNLSRKKWGSHVLPSAGRENKPNSLLPVPLPSFSPFFCHKNSSLFTWSPQLWQCLYSAASLCSSVQTEAWNPHPCSWLKVLPRLRMALGNVTKCSWLWFLLSRGARGPWMMPLEIAQWSCGCSRTGEAEWCRGGVFQDGCFWFWDSQGNGTLRNRPGEETRGENPLGQLL